jgi:polysaccharide export outer membrane protein
MRNWVCSVLAAVLFVAFSHSAMAEYRLRPGDTLELTVWQEPKLNRRFVVAPDGRISIPLVGHLRAGGFTVESVEARVAAKLKTQYTTDLDVSLSLAAVKEDPFIPEPPPPPEEKPPDPTFYVTGEVLKPGQYPFNRPTNVLQAIAVAGGLGPFAAGHRIKIRRKVDGVEQLFDFDYEDFVSGEDLSGNIRLHHGDVIVVPEKRLFE